MERLKRKTKYNTDGTDCQASILTENRCIIGSR